MMVFICYMKIIIKESQYLNLLIEAKSNIYTDKAQYDKALKKYNDVWYGYKEILKSYDYFKKGNNKIPVANLNSPDIKKRGSFCRFNFSTCELEYIINSEKKFFNRNLGMYEITKMMEKYKMPKEYEVTFRFKKDGLQNYTINEVSKGENCDFGSYGGFCLRVYKKPTLKKPIYQPPTDVKPIEPKKTIELPKNTSVVSYEELKSNSSFAPWLPTGTPIVKVGSYYLTYPEFENYKKKNPTKKFTNK